MNLTISLLLVVSHVVYLNRRDFYEMRVYWNCVIEFGCTRLKALCSDCYQEGWVAEWGAGVITECRKS